MQFQVSSYNKVNIKKKQECIPVGCVPPALYRRRVSLIEHPPDRDPPGQRHPPPPPVNRKTPVKTLPSQTSFTGGKYCVLKLTTLALCRSKRDQRFKYNNTE